jgi:glycosyltransferase involved in cell wall biosynthesis
VSPGGGAGPGLPPYPLGRMPELSVVAPAFNQATTIAASLAEILRRLERRGLDFELIVVSDGSRDATYETVRRVAAADPRVRVLDYDRNLGKGFAVRTGSLAARGEWVAWIDSDLDLDPSRIAEFLARAKAESLDVVVGSKRHPDSDVAYPRRRRVYSWLYQMMVRALFALDVRDTQVGMKLFRREVLDRVLPVVLVKRYAFDLEVLAISRRFGFGRIAESPITLEYQFTGSGVGWRAIANALWDTAAVFYRLRLRRYYDRQRVFCDRVAGGRPALDAPRLTVVSAPAVVDEGAARRIEGVARSLPGDRTIIVTGRVEGRPPEAPGLSVIETAEARESERLRMGVERAETELVGLIAPGARPSGGWAAAARNLLADDSVGVVVGPSVPRLGNDLREDAAGILTESRLGVGSARLRSSVGRMHEIDDFPLRNAVTRRSLLMEAIGQGEELSDELCAALRSRTGLRAIFSPDAVVTTTPNRLFGPYLRRVHGVGIDRGARLLSGRGVRAGYLTPVGLICVAALGLPAAAAGGAWLALWAALMALYALSLAGLGALTFVLHRRPRLSLLVMAGAAASHLAFGLGMLRGLLGRHRRRPASELRPAPR